MLNLTASLSWYDHPASRPGIDAFWLALRDSLRRDGVAAPDALDRDTPIIEQWRNPNLLIAQCCGPDLDTPNGHGLIPFARPVFADLDCEPGSYFSFVVGNLNRGARLAVNSYSSWSGHGALSQWMQMHQVTASEMILSGSHERSVALVREGQADIAAIDAHTWSLIDTDSVNILDRTGAVPAPPYVTRQQEDADRAALLHGVRVATSQRGGEIGIVDVVESSVGDYRTLFGTTLA